METLLDGQVERCNRAGGAIARACHDAAPALDDRFAAALTLRTDAPAFRLAARLRATTAGRFELPGAEVMDMYRPAFLARQAAARISVGE